ncbi:MAG: hypothetical protein NVS3B26_19770 [Mycobacteriales bacterium]
MIARLTVVARSAKDSTRCGVDPVDRAAGAKAYDGRGWLAPIGAATAEVPGGRDVDGPLPIGWGAPADPATAVAAGVSAGAVTAAAGALADALLDGSGW